MMYGMTRDLSSLSNDIIHESSSSSGSENYCTVSHIIYVDSTKCQSRCHAASSISVESRRLVKAAIALFVRVVLCTTMLL